MAQRHLFIACYDIADPKRLRQGLRVLRHYSTGGQKSVFECYLTPAERHSLVAGIAEVINPTEDRFLLLRLDARRKVRVLGIAIPPANPAYFYVG